MMKYLPFAIWTLALAGGMAGGVMLKASSAPADPHAKESAQALADARKSAKAASKKEEKAEKGRKGEDGHGKSGAETSNMGFVKFGRQFIVPVMDKTGVKSLVIMDLSVEVPPSQTDKAYAAEPKLRDALLSALLQLSDDGAFSGKILAQKNLDGVRAALLAAARKVIGEDAQNVLILGVTRQDT